MRAWLDGVRKPFADLTALRRQVRYVAPALSLVGIVIAGLLTWQLFVNPASIAGQGNADKSQGPGVVVHNTPAPSDVVVTNPEVTVPGTLVYVKLGNLWVQEGSRTRQITISVDGSAASQPTWSPDGQWIYYIDTRITNGIWYNPNKGNAVDSYKLYYPVLCRVKPDGTGREDVLSGLIVSKSLKTFYWIRQPSISPDGNMAVVVSDGPTGPGDADTVLHLVDLAKGRLLGELGMPERRPLGHGDPSYSQDGSRIAYVMEGRSGSRGVPSVWLYDVAQKTGKKLAVGYRGPSWSPDGRFLAVTKVSGDRLDIVILDAATGKEVGRVTSDGSSWAPVWSQRGDELVYMHLDGSVVDLYMVHVTTDAAGTFIFKVEPNLTQYSGLDGSSRAAWYIPPTGRASPAP